MRQLIRLCCDSVPYRQGFIEVCDQIHDGLINLETWDISAETDIAGRRMEDLPEDAFLANVDLELTPVQARDLAASIIAAADAAEDS